MTWWQKLISIVVIVGLIIALFFLVTSSIGELIKAKVIV